MKSIQIRKDLAFHIWRSDDKWFSRRVYNGTDESQLLGPFDTEFDAYEAIKQDTLDYERIEECWI